MVVGSSIDKVYMVMDFGGMDLKVRTHLSFFTSFNNNYVNSKNDNIVIVVMIIYSIKSGILKFHLIIGYIAYLTIIQNDNFYLYKYHDYKSINFN